MDLVLKLIISVLGLIVYDFTLAESHSNPDPSKRKKPSILVKTGYNQYFCNTVKTKNGVFEKNNIV